MSDYPKLLSVDCAVCGQPVTLIIELVIRTPLIRDGLNPLPFDPEPTVLSGCEHFYRREEQNR